MQHDQPARSERSSESPVFNTTHWSVVVRAGETSSSQSQAALQMLCQAYWYPLYAYVRRQGHSVEDAQDSVQEFFARFLENRRVRLANPARGRFRTFLLTSLKNFLINEWTKANREKRGGGQRLLSLDEAWAESRFRAEPAIAQPPDSLYDRGWAATLLDRALAALRAEFEQAGKLAMFERFRNHITGEHDPPPYAELAVALGMTEGAVRVALHRLSKRYGELLRAEVAQTVSTPAEVNEELRYLVSVIRDNHGAVGNNFGEML